MHLSGSQLFVCVSTTVPLELELRVVFASVSEQVAPPLAGGGLSQVRVLLCVLFAVTLLHGPHWLQPPAVGTRKKVGLLGPKKKSAGLGSGELKHKLSWTGMSYPQCTCRDRSSWSVSPQQCRWNSCSGLCWSLCQCRWPRRWLVLDCHRCGSWFEGYWRWHCSMDPMHPRLHLEE